MGYVQVSIVRNRALFNFLFHEPVDSHCANFIPVLGTSLHRHHHHQHPSFYNFIVQQQRKENKRELFVVHKNKSDF
jgi:hypothetical protein